MIFNDNPITFPPESILQEGTRTTLAFLKEHMHGNQPVWESKIIVVGEAGVGKTSLIKSMKGMPFNNQEETTHGLDIHLFPLNHPTQKNTTMDLSIWDFGGQQILHATHQFFLTKRALFILVWSARTGYKQSKMEYWLETINARDAEAPILIVAAHAESWDPSFTYQEVRGKYPTIKGTFAISNKKREQTHESFTALLNTIKTESAALPLMGTTWPKSWRDTAAAIRANSETHTTPTRLKKIMHFNGVQEFNVLSDYLHSLGYILYFRENEELDDHVILKPGWLAKNISKVLEKGGGPEGKALLTKELANKLWADVDEPVRDLFLRMMDVFDLSYKIDDRREISLVVEKLSQDPASYQSLWEDKKEREVSIIYKFTNSLPPGIPAWFIARSHRFTTHIHWRYGALLADGPAQNHLALIRAYDHERYLDIRVRGPEPANFFALLRDGMDLTIKRYPGITPELTIPCICTPGCSWEFPLEALKLSLKNRCETLPCYKTFKQVSIARIMYGIEPSGMLRELNELKGNNQELKELIQRESLKSLRFQQSKEDSRYPKLFIIWPKEEGVLRRWNRLGGIKICLQLACEAPGCWHLLREGGNYEIELLPEWQGPFQSAFDKMVKTLQTAGPILTAGSGLLFPEVSKSLKFMSELAKISSHEKRNIQNDDPPEFLRRILIDQDPHGRDWGLHRVFTKEGHIYWLCPAHKAQFDRHERFQQL